MGGREREGKKRCVCIVWGEKGRGKVGMCVHCVRWRGRGDRWMCALCEREGEGGDVDVRALFEREGEGGEVGWYYWWLGSA